VARRSATSDGTSSTPPQLKYQIDSKFALALEGYGIVERLWNSGSKSDERVLFGDVNGHLLGPVFYYSWGADDDQSGRKAGKGLRVRAVHGKIGDHAEHGDKEGAHYTLSAGVLFGLNENTADAVLKLNLGVDF
jgi:hypothetical protein